MTRIEKLKEVLELETEIDVMLIKLFEAKDLQEFEYYRQMIHVNISAIKFLQSQ